MSSDDSDGMFIGMTYLPHIMPCPVKSRVMPSHHRNGMPRITFLFCFILLINLVTKEAEPMVVVWQSVHGDLSLS